MATTRTPVVANGGRRVPGLYSRVTNDGDTVYEFRGRLAPGAPVVTRKLEALTKTDAIRECRVLQGTGETSSPSVGGATFADLAESFLAHIEARVDDRDPKRRYSRRTVALYRQRLEAHVVPLLGSMPLSRIAVADLRRLIDKMSGLSGSTVTSTLNITSRAFQHGIRTGLVGRNPVRDLDRDDRPSAKRESEPRYLTADELDALLAEVGDTFRPVAAVCAFAGLRVSEALGLTWGDVDFERGTLTVAAQLSPEGDRVPLKSAASAATLPMFPRLVDELREHNVRQVVAGNPVAPDALVFATSRGKPQSRHNAARAIRRAADSAGLVGDGREPVSPHDLRHTFVALAIRHGVSIAEAARMARHASPSVTVAVYAGLQDDGLAVAFDKLTAAGFGS